MSGSTSGLAGVRWAKGHGTENDFVLIPDVDDGLDLDTAAVRRLCDRRAGIGADGVLRVVRRHGLWFMDYRNADGSIAEMCGNGIRVYVAYLVHAGLEPDGDGEVVVETRAGIKRVRRMGGLYAAELGPWRIPGGEPALIRGADATVQWHGRGTGPNALTGIGRGLSVDVGNPHVVVPFPDEVSLAALDLARAPAVEPNPANGVNVELIVRGDDGPGGRGHLTMRVHERGVGETRSCGTGAVAAALAARALAKEEGRDTWTVDVPGGRLQVVVTGDLVAGASVELIGPAVIVADGVLTGA